MAKDDHLHNLCRTREDYRKLWDTMAADPEPPRIEGYVKTPDYGPGTELEALIKELQLPALTGCGCKAKARQMDRWGVEGCRENFETIQDWLEEAAGKTDLGAKLVAAFSAPLSLAIRINPLDPIPSLIRESIRRAEVKLNEHLCPS